MHIRQITSGHVTSIMYHFVPIVTTPVVLIPQVIVTLVHNSQGYKYQLLMPYSHSPTICDHACENQPCERKLHLVTFL